MYVKLQINFCKIVDLILLFIQSFVLTRQIFMISYSITKRSIGVAADQIVNYIPNLKHDVPVFLLLYVLDILTCYLYGIDKLYHHV